MPNRAAHDPTEPSKSLTSIPTDPDRPLKPGTIGPNEIAEFERRNDLNRFPGKPGKTLALAREIRARILHDRNRSQYGGAGHLKQTRTAWAAREGKTTRQINAEVRAAPPRHQTNRANTKTLLTRPEIRTIRPIRPMCHRRRTRWFVSLPRPASVNLQATGTPSHQRSNPTCSIPAYQSALFRFARLSDWRLGRRRTIV